MFRRREIASTIAAAILATTLGLGLAHAQTAPAQPAAAAAKAEKYISLTQAAEIAQKLHPQGLVKKVELDRELLRTVYEVEVKISATEKYDVEIDAVTGEVLRNQRDY